MNPSPSASVEAVFGKYTLIAKLATGGMGEIFLARLGGMAGFEKLVVIKRLLPHLAEDQHFVTMLLDEARIAARLNHPNVCQVNDVGEVFGEVYIAMEYLEGVPSSQLLQAARRAGDHVDVRLAASLLMQSCQGLHHAHELRDRNGKPIELVHRDVSPSNLFVTVSGAVKVLDFGVAKSQDARSRTHTGALKGKYAYMSPEQVLTNPLDRRSDIFSLGIVFFELLTTRRLFWRDSEYKMFQAICEDDIPNVLEFNPTIPVSIAEVVAKALSRDPDGRFETAQAMSEAIAAAIEPLGGPATNVAIGQYVSERFAEQISERRELVQSAVSVHAQPTVTDGQADMGAHSQEFAPHDYEPEISIESDPIADLLGEAKAAKRRAWMVPAIAVVVALLAIGGYMFMKQDGEATADTDKSPVVVVVEGGEVKGNDGTVIRKPDDKATKPTDDLTAVIDEDLPPAGDEAEPTVKMSAAGRIGRQLMKQKGASLQKCLLDHNEDGNAVSMRLDLKVQAGKVTRAAVQPRNIARTELGKCLRRVARTVRFSSRSNMDIELPLVLNSDG